MTRTKSTGDVATERETINKQNIKHFGISVRQKQRNLYATFYFRLHKEANETNTLNFTKKQTKQIP